MVAYSFQPQFEAPILSGRKFQTIREVGKRRHARPCEALQLYRGMRTRACRLIGRAVCLSVAEIKISLPKGPITIRTPLPDGGWALRGIGSPIGNQPTTESLEEFAQADGFETFSEMVAFWAKHHPGVLQFDGNLIVWGAFEKGPDYA